MDFVKSRAVICLCLLVIFNKFLDAGTLLHYAPGVYNIRDFYIPDAGFYVVLYAPYYHTETYKDSYGTTINSVSAPSRLKGVRTLSFTTDIDVAAISPEFIWAPHFDAWGGGRFGAYVAPSFANSNVSASLETASGRDVSSTHSQFAVGDLFVQPIWLDWTKAHWDFSAAYGFYAPTGKFGTDPSSLQVSGVRVTGIATDNVGLGFWENQFQGAMAWYPWTDKRMAVSLVGTYEIGSGQKGTGITPGNEFTLNWGISNYFPLSANKQLLFEIGPAGYCEWQTTYDRGNGVVSGNNPLSDVLAAGFQAGFTYVPWMAFLNFRYSNEFGAKARFQGETSSVSIGKKI